MTKKDYKRIFQQRIGEHAEMTMNLSCIEGMIGMVTEKICSAFRKGRKIMVFGNGGSAADAQHIVTELLGKYYLYRKGLPAIALTVNTSSITAISNDRAFGDVFSTQIEALGARGDIAWGLSTSGRSPNVIKALRQARRMGITTIAFTGSDGGPMKNNADFCIRVPSRDTPRIQEAHILIGHIICEIVEQELFGKR